MSHALTRFNRVNIGGSQEDPSALLHVQVENITQDQNTLGGITNSSNQTSSWQSYIAGKNGNLPSIQWKLDVLVASNITWAVYSGTGTGGTLLAINTVALPVQSGGLVTLGVGASPQFAQQILGQTYTIAISSPTAYRNYWSGPSVYPNGTNNLGVGDYQLITFVNSTVTPLRIDSTGNSSLTLLQNPTANSDASNKLYVDTSITNAINNATVTNIINASATQAITVSNVGRTTINANGIANQDLTITMSVIGQVVPIYKGSSGGNSLRITAPAGSTINGGASFNFPNGQYTLRNLALISANTYFIG